MADWYYIGHYGQIGPLTRETMTDLIDTGVITRDTFVWQTGMPDWQSAGVVTEFSMELRGAPMSMPPPSPTATPKPFVPPVASFGAPNMPQRVQQQFPVYGHIRSDKSRLIAGLLQFLPIVGGIGRIYLGYTAIGVLQMVSSLCGVGYIWSIIDGILMLVGQVKYDGYGRTLPE